LGKSHYSPDLYPDQLNTVDALLLDGQEC
jgi:hypothetical protein